MAGSRDIDLKSHSNPARKVPDIESSMRDFIHDPLGFFLSISRQYGDIVRYRPAPEPAYLINHPDYIQHVLVSNHQNYTKETYSNRMFKLAVADGLLTSEGETWKQQRRLMQPSFHHQRLANVVPIITQETTRMLEGWAPKAEDGQPIDIAQEMAALTLKIIGKVLFGLDISQQAGSVGQAVTLGVALLEKPRHNTFKQALKEVEKIVHTIIEMRRNMNQDTGDLLSTLLVAQDAETGMRMDDRQLRDQILTLLLAGYETTASALTWTWYLLSQHPAWQMKLHREVSDFLGDRTPVEEDLPKMDTTRMVFEESMRLYPPAWIIGRKSISEDSIAGYPIPANATIAISPYVVHRHPDFWEDPDTFDPERFAPGSANKHPRYAYIPFGGGPRMCIGKNLAMLEAQLILALMARKYSLHLLPGKPVKPEPLFILRPNRGELLMTLHDYAA